MKYQQHTDNVRLTLRIPNELHVHVTQYATQHGVSFNRAMVEMLAAGQKAVAQSTQPD